MLLEGRVIKLATHKNTGKQDINSCVYNYGGRLRFGAIKDVGNDPSRGLEDNYAKNAWAPLELNCNGLRL